MNGIYTAHMLHFEREQRFEHQIHGGHACSSNWPAYIVFTNKETNCSSDIVSYKILEALASATIYRSLTCKTTI